MNRIACRVAELGFDLDRPSLLWRHRGECLHCQAKAARDHRMQRLLQTLRSDTEIAPEGLMDQVMASVLVEPHAPYRRGTRVMPRVATAGGAVIAAAAGATAVVVWRRGHLPA